MVIKKVIARRKTNSTRGKEEEIIKDEDSGSTIIIKDDSTNTALSDTMTTITTTLGDSFSEKERHRRSSQHNHIRKNPNKLKVSFGDIEIRSHEIILGDNPGVSGGPPLTIDWEPFELSACSVDEYEYEKAKMPTRDIFRMKMTTEQRIKLLAKTNSMREINTRTKQVTDARRQRAETRSTLYRQDNHEKMEKVFRGFKNMFSNKKKKEMAYIASAMQGPKMVADVSCCRM